VLGDLEKRVKKIKKDLEECRRSGIIWERSGGKRSFVEIQIRKTRRTSGYLLEAKISCQLAAKRGS
jgi:hypothetical protein